MEFRLPRRIVDDIAIDLGTANTLVHARGRGIVLSEPSIVALERESRAVVAVGHAAKAMLGRTPASIEVIRPVRSGVIADCDAAQAMLRRFLARLQGWNPLRRPRMVIGVPSGVTPVEKRAVREAVAEAGARTIHLVEEPMAAAIGAGLPIHEPGGHVVVDIGGGTTEVAVISLSGIVHCQSVRMAGDEMDAAIVQYLRKHYNMVIGERRAEEIKLALSGARQAGDGPRLIVVKGSDAVARVPKAITVSEDEVREAIADCVAGIVGIVRTSLERTPPEIAADMVDSGIVLAGGGALLEGLDEIVRKETYLPVSVAKDPLSCVARGLGALLDDADLLERVSVED
ncbi:MAG TPA: rod shape-determining protein [Methylomirabilota bacterium]|jgi:rod shape-determining protein MreB|nr:rod shape-determining protein [Methylomirabilota bacterium]